MTPERSKMMEISQQMKARNKSKAFSCIIEWEMNRMCLNMRVVITLMKIPSRMLMALTNEKSNAKFKADPASKLSTAPISTNPR